MSDDAAALPLDAHAARWDGLDLISPDQEARIFWQLRRRGVLTLLKQALRRSRLRMSLVVGLSVFFWFGLYVLFGLGFQVISSAIGNTVTHAQTVQVIYSVFFVSLMVMLVLSAGIILYSGLYCSGEAGLLLSLPVRPSRIVLHKFQDAIFFSSWGFLLLGSPMLVAYGVVEQAPWYYFALLVPFMLAFIYIPGCIGAILCLIVVRRLPQFGWRAMAATTTIVLGLGLCTGWILIGAPENNILTPSWFQEVLARLQISEHRLLPSWWLSSGLLEAARRESGPLDSPPWAESLLFLAVLISNAMVAHLALIWTANRTYRVGYSALAGLRNPRRSRRPGWSDRLILRLLPGLSMKMRLLIVKDLRLFRRDPVQWSQFLIFFGLLALYFVNIRKLSYDVNYAGWVSMISFLNLAVVGLILSTFTTRFIFPMISLEGRRFWILGLLPVRRESILWGKFLFAAAGACLPCGVLIFLSDAMLGVSPRLIGLHQLTCLLLCTGLSGIAVGLGARMPDLRETSPSKIAAGFGGTLNLVLSAIYIVLVVLLTAVPSHFFLAAEQAGMELASVELWLNVSIGAAVALGLVATLVPMRIGLAAFRRMEF